jgi:multisubunit Na+/H+ antiporter MnhC subunit
MATFPAVLGAVLWAIGIWIIVYGFLLKWGYGLLLILAGTALLIVSVGVLRTRGSGHVRSFWVFDRPEKDKWEDVDRVIRR